MLFDTFATRVSRVAVFTTIYFPDLISYEHRRVLWLVETQE
jgi:hypothetical protein